MKEYGGEMLGMFGTNVWNYLERMYKMLFAILLSGLKDHVTHWNNTLFPRAVNHPVNSLKVCAFIPCWWLVILPFLCWRFVWQSSQAARLWSQVVAGHLYTLPSNHTPTGPRGHTVKHFLTLCQDSWQIKFFLLTCKRFTLNLLILLQECRPGFSRNKSSMVKLTNSCCLCFGISTQASQLHKRKAAFFVSILGRQVSCSAKLNIELLVSIVDVGLLPWDWLLWKHLIPSPLHVHWINCPP